MLPLLLFAGGIIRLQLTAATSHWIWSVVAGKQNASECDTEACAGVTSFGGVVLSSSDEVDACLLSVPSSCAFEVTAAPLEEVTGSITTAGGDTAIYVDLHSLDAADEVPGIFRWGGGDIEVLLAKPVSDDGGCLMAIGYSSRICNQAAFNRVAAAQTVSAAAGDDSFTISPHGVYNSEFKCLQVYPGRSWNGCGGAIREVKFQTPRLVNSLLKGRLDFPSGDERNDGDGGRTVVAEDRSDSDLTERIEGAEVGNSVGRANAVTEVYTPTAEPGTGPEISSPFDADYIPAIGE